jgi:hypothetical protein
VKSGSQLFLSSMVFGFVIALIYGLSTHEPIGIFLLGLMGIGMLIIFGFLRMRERQFTLLSDDRDAFVSQEAGQTIETFASRSPWPFVIAVGVVLLLVPLIYVPAFSLVGLAIILYALYAFMQEIMPRRAMLSDKRGREDS